MLIDYTVSKIIYTDAKNPLKIFAYAKGEECYITRTAYK